jgi:hypothetical protein
MATRTLKAKYETLDRSVSRTRAILCHSKNVKKIYYQYEVEVEAPPAESASDAAAAPSALAAPAAPVAVAAPSGPVASVEDVPVKAIDILLVVVAQKLKKRIDRRSLFRKLSKIWLVENRRCRMKSSIARDNSADFKVIKLSDSFKASMFFLAPISASTSRSLNPLALSDLSHFRGPLDLEKVVVILVSAKLDLGVALVHDGRWRLAANLLLKAASRWPGLWASSNTLTVA